MTFIYSLLPKILNDYYCYNSECFYFRYALFNLLVLTFLFLVKKTILKALSKIKYLNNFKINTYKRKVIIISTLVILIIYFFRMNTGFIFPGICGWTFDEPVKKLKYNQKQIAQLGLPDSLAFLKTAIKKENLKYIKENYEYLGNAMFIHFEEKKIKPANFELLEFVFPLNLTPLMADSTFIKCVSNSLKYRRKGRKTFKSRY